MRTPLLNAEGGEQLPPLLLTVPQAAHMLAISRSAMYQLVWNGEVTPVHIGRSVRFTVAELERFVAARVTSDGGMR
jgi:excisionase family DNA binding protein